MGPTDAARSLRVLAERIAERLPPELGEEVAVTGSASRGVADEWSDLELMLCVRELPSLEACAAWADALGAETHGIDPWEDRIYFDGSLEGAALEFVWQTLDATERRLSALLDGAVDTGALHTAEALANAVVLRGTGFLVGWQRRLGSYPDGLRAALIHDALEPWEPPRKLGSVRRHDRIAVVAELLRDARSILRVVFAVNGLWEPEWKWLRLRTAELPAVPARLVDRLEQALVEPDAAAALRAMSELALETLSLVPEHLETGRAERSLRQAVASL